MAVAQEAASKRQPNTITEEVFIVEDQPGVTEPFGFFDPLNLCPRGKTGFRKYRVAELKHGRVAMLASVGLVAQHWIRLPGGAFDEVPNGIGALFSIQGSIGFCAIFFAALVLEFLVWTQDPSKEVGDFGDPFRFGMDSSEMKNRELNNGRFAMFATMGILVAEVATGKDAIEQFGIDVVA